jgi:hypothetical protein
MWVRVRQKVSMQPDPSNTLSPKSLSSYTCHNPAEGNESSLGGETRGSTWWAQFSTHAPFPLEYVLHNGPVKITTLSVTEL